MAYNLFVLAIVMAIFLLSLPLVAAVYVAISAILSGRNFSELWKEL